MRRFASYLLRLESSAFGLCWSFCESMSPLLSLFVVSSLGLVKLLLVSWLFDCGLEFLVGEALLVRSALFSCRRARSELFPCRCVPFVWSSLPGFSFTIVRLSSLR